jgi:small subunit ribosomal protein S21|tara:strand:- start:20 stop:229 length:210 start_codon:yes stop_codon:yes gene_type:complete
VVKVIIKNDRFFEKSMKKFSRKVDKVGIIKEVRSRTYYEKPSVKKRIQKKYSAAKYKREARINEKRSRF